MHVMNIEKEAKSVACAIEKLQFITMGINFYIYIDRKIHNILEDKHA